MFAWSNHGDKVFWFQQSKAGNQTLIRPDGTRKTIRRKPRNACELTSQAIAGFQRAWLLQDEYNIWDGMGFSCTMQAIIGVRCPASADEKNVLLLFASCQDAERTVYPYLAPAAVEECRRNVDRFYADANLQAAWNTYILHPVCLKKTQDVPGYTPLFIGDIGDGESVFRYCSVTPISSLEDSQELDDPLASEHF